MGRGHLINMLGLCVLFLAGCERKPEKMPTGVAPIAVAVVAAREADWPRVVSVPATVSAADTAQLASRAGGWVTSVEVDAGAHVAKGALLAEVGAADPRGRLAEARSHLAAAQAALNEAANNERRSQALLRAHVVSPQQYEAVHRRFLTAKADADAANAALDVAKTNLDYADIRAPFAGVVAEKNVRPGDFAAPGATLFVLANDEPQIRAYVGPKTFETLDVGEEAEAVIGDRTVHATVTLVSDAADPATRAHLVELRPQGPITAPYGAYAELRLAVGHAPRLVVPESALVRRAGLQGVFVIDSARRAHFRLVRAGEKREGLVAVEAGLAAGETVVIAPPDDLANDSAVVAKAAAQGAKSEEAPRE